MRRLDKVGLSIFLFAVLIASVGLFTYFSLDDYIYLHRAEEHTSSLKTLFAPFYTFSPWLSYRPLPTMFWVMLFWLFGASPMPFAIGVVLLFAGVVFYIYRIGTLLGGRVTGLISGALVAIYFPVYSVAWSKWSSSLQMELFLLASAMFYLTRWAKAQSGSEQRTRLPAMGILLMIGAFLSKETSLMVPLLLPLLVAKRHVIKLAGGLFLSGVGIFVLSRTLIASQFPLPEPRLEFSLIFRNLEFFLREQFLFYLPASLIVMAALAWGNRNRHVWLLASMGLFVSMNVVLGHTNTAHRLKLAVCSAAVIYCVFKAPARVRFSLGWAALLLLPPLSVLDTTLHQSAESFLGLSLFIGMGLARQMRLVRRMIAVRFQVPSSKFQVGDSIRIALGAGRGLGSWLRIGGALACAPLLAYAAYTVASLNVRIAVPEARRMVQTSRLTRDVREYLCSTHGDGVSIHSTNLPGLISVPDIPFDARLNGCTLSVDDDLSATEGIFVVSGGTPKEVIDGIRSRSRLVKRLVRAPYEVMVFSTSD